MMQFWPFAVGIAGSGVVTLVAIAFFIKIQRPDVKGVSPHHKWNQATDLRQAERSDRARH